MHRARIVSGDSPLDKSEFKELCSCRGSAAFDEMTGKYQVAEDKFGKSAINLYNFSAKITLSPLE